MSRSVNSTSPVVPVNTTGTEQPLVNSPALGKGSVLLLTGVTYFFPIGGQDATTLSAHVRWDANLILTSITIEDCNENEVDVPLYSDNSGEWIDEDPSTAFVGTDGAGVTPTNGVVAVTGGAAGGAMFHMNGTGARRTRVKVVVGATGGYMKVSPWSKE